MYLFRYEVSIAAIYSYLSILVYQHPKELLSCQASQGMAGFY